MDVAARLLQAGFDRVLVLSGAECGIAEPTLLLAVMTYEAEQQPDTGGAWVHPYYFASQRAYQAAMTLVREAREEGVGLVSRDELRVKPLFARMPGVTQGRNTISYLPGVGSRFHVQIFTLDVPLTPTLHLTEQPHGLHCGDCTLCWQVCPTHALDAEGFHRERCLRNWQLNGQSVPEALRAHMGDRLIGCDTCQRSCPHNPAPMGESHTALPLAELLGNAKAACAPLKEAIGANLALPNRVLAQACLLAGCGCDASLLPLLDQLRSHPSPTVREHAAWAYEQLNARCHRA